VPRVHEEPAGVGAVFAIIAITVTALLVPIRDWLGNTNVALILVGLIVAAAAIGGRLAGIVTAVAAALSYNFFHTEPHQTLRIDDRQDILTFILLPVVGVAVGELAVLRTRARHEAAEHASGAHDLERAVACLTSGEPLDAVWACVKEGLGHQLCVRAATFAPGEPAAGASSIDRAGRLVPSPSKYSGGAFEIPDSTGIAVVADGREIGHVRLTTTQGRGTTIDERRLAVALVDVLGAALVRSGRAPTLT
jgi:Domain of unknown function (DUF4118)